MLNSKVLNIYNKFYKNSLLLIVSLFLLNCQTNPASGDKEFTLMSKEEEKSIGKFEHKKIIKQFGGVYDNLKLKNYIDSLGNFLVSTSELSNQKFTFTILDSHIVNAFALPGGYIYVTRGLLALCKNEAQLSGVLAHEIGHVTARHSARRYTKVFGTGVLANIIGSVLGTNNYALENLVGQTANLYLLSYSRDQEYEADNLALRYMSKAGFKIDEMGGFLSSMEKYKKLYFKMNKLEIANSQSDLLSTHPLSSKRVDRVLIESKKFNIASPIIGKEMYLKKIDGISFGEKSSEGTLFKNTFVHPALKIEFSFNNYFYFINKPKYIIGLGPNKEKIIIDIDSSKNRSTDILEYAKKILGKKFPNTYNRSLINGLEYIDIVYKKSKNKNRLAIIKDGENYFRILLTENTKKLSVKSDAAFQKILSSFKKISERDKILNSRKVLKKIRVKNGDTIDKLSDMQSLQPQFSKQIFKTINGLEDRELLPGESLKIVSIIH